MLFFEKKIRSAFLEVKFYFEKNIRIALLFKIAHIKLFENVSGRYMMLSRVGILRFYI